MAENNGTNGTNGSSDPSAGTTPPWMNSRMVGFLANAMSMSRQELFRQLSDPRRDIDDECGYPRTGSLLGAHVYQDLYDREAIPARVVECLPAETWQVFPQVYESEDPGDVTEFEEAWDSLGSTLRGEQSWYYGEEGSLVYDYLYRADEQCGIGHYGVILLGLDDGKAAREPAEMVNTDASWFSLDYEPDRDSETGKKVTNAAAERKRKQKQRSLLYMRVFPESLAQIIRYDDDRTSPRYGQPVAYQITYNDPRGPYTGIGLNTATEEVHWSRVVHVVDNRGSSEVFGVPRMQTVLNRLLDLRKIYSADGEGYWRNGILKLFLETHPDLGGDVDIDHSQIKDDFEKMMNGLQQWMTLRGLSPKSVPPAVSDPTPHVNVQLEAICIKLGIPVRVFKGSERGELASSQDDQAWNDRLRKRQRSHVTPRIIVPTVDRLIALGVLPPPKAKSLTTNRRGSYTPDVRGGRAYTTKRTYWVYNAKSGKIEPKEVYGTASRSKAGYCVFWPDLTSQTEAEKASVAGQKTSTIGSYVSSGAEALVPPREFLTTIMKLTDEEADAILEAAAARLEEEAGPDGAAEHGLLPLPSAGAGANLALGLFNAHKGGVISEETLKQLLMFFLRVSEEKAEQLIADGLPEPPSPPGGLPGLPGAVPGLPPDAPPDGEAPPDIGSDDLPPGPDGVGGGSGGSGPDLQSIIDAMGGPTGNQRRQPERPRRLVWRSVETTNHLPGKHDQASHAGGKNTTAARRTPETEPTKTKPTVGSSTEEVLRAKAGDKAAREAVVRDNQGLVHKIAKGFARNFPTKDRKNLFDELVSEGNLGLLRAIDKFEDTKGAKFGTYAHHWVEGKIRNYVTKKGKELRERQAAKESGFDPAAPEVRDHAADEARREVSRLLEGLDARSQDIIAERFGLGGRAPKTQDELAKKYKVSKVRISQLEAKALEKMRGKLTANTRSERTTGDVVRLLRLAANVFCPTGEGGGIDPTCSPEEAGGAGSSGALAGWTGKLTESEMYDRIDQLGRSNGLDLESLVKQVKISEPRGTGDDQTMSMGRDGTLTVYPKNVRGQEHFDYLLGHELGHGVDLSIGYYERRGPVYERLKGGITSRLKKLEREVKTPKSHPDGEYHRRPEEVFAELVGFAMTGKTERFRPGSKVVAEAAGWFKANVFPELEAVTNTFCPTGTGGGVDPTCSPGEGGRPAAVPAAKSAERFRQQTPSSIDEAVERFKQVSVKHFGKEPNMAGGFDIDLPGGRRIDVFLKTHYDLDADKDAFSARIDFTVQGRDDTSVGESLEKDSLAMLRKVRDLAQRYHDAGFSIEVQPADQRRRELYAKTLRKMGLTLQPKRRREKEGVETWNVSPLSNAFCPTGPGGGIDPTCSPGGSDSKLAERTSFPPKAVPVKGSRVARVVRVVGRKLLRKLQAAGAKAEHIEHVAAEYARDKVQANVARLPSKVQKAVRAAYFVGKLGTKAAFASWTVSQALAERVAVERGMTAEQAAKFRGTLMKLDVLAAKPATVGLGAVSGGTAAFAGSFVPAATAGYLAYSGVRNPVKTYRAAKGVIKDVLARRKGKKGRAAGLVPQTPHRSTQPTFRPGIEELPARNLRWRSVSEAKNNRGDS